MLITPTVGRVVWFYPNGLRDVLTNAQPHAALVTYVHGDRMVNLAIFNADGVSYNRTSVVLVQEGDNNPDSWAFCCWMPYQAAQAKKHQA